MRRLFLNFRKFCLITIRLRALANLTHVVFPFNRRPERTLRLREKQRVSNALGTFCKTVSVCSKDLKASMF